MANFCRQCGNPLSDGDRFCAKCGTAVAKVAEPCPGGQGLPSGISMDQQGTLRWQYEQDMWKHPVVLILIIKIFYAICMGLGAFLFALCALDGDVMEGLKMFVIVGLGIGTLMAVLALMAWGLMSLARGGKYCFEFEMNEKMVVHHATQQEKNRRRTILGLLFFLSPQRSLSTAALAMTPVSMATSYDEVKTIEAVREHDLIKVNGTLDRNQVYAAPEQYDFVWNYIVSRCPQAKILTKRKIG